MILLYLPVIPSMEVETILEATGRLRRTGGDDSASKSHEEFRIGDLFIIAATFAAETIMNTRGGIPLGRLAKQGEAPLDRLSRVGPSVV